METPSATPTENPSQGITDPVISFSSYDGVEDEIYIVSGQVTISWDAGENATYRVKITDSNGQVLQDQAVTSTSLSFDASILTPGLGL